MKVKTFDFYVWDDAPDPFWGQLTQMAETEEKARQWCEEYLRRLVEDRRTELNLSALRLTLKP